MTETTDPRFISSGQNPTLHEINRLQAGFDQNLRDTSAIQHQLVQSAVASVFKTGTAAPLPVEAPAAPPAPPTEAERDAAADAAANARAAEEKDAIIASLLAEKAERDALDAEKDDEAPIEDAKVTKKAKK